MTNGLILPVVFEVAHDVHGGCQDSDSDDNSVSDLLGEWDSGSWRSRDPCLVGERSGQDPGGGDDQGAGGSGDHVVDELLFLSCKEMKYSIERTSRQNGCQPSYK